MAVESFVVQRVELLCDIIPHEQGEYLRYVAVLRKEEIELLPPPRNILAGVVSSQRHL